MLNLFLEFLSYIVNNLIEYVAVLTDEETFQNVFRAYLLFNRMTSYLEEFSHELTVWQKDRCHGRAWSECQEELLLINYVMHLLDADLKKIIGPLDSEKKAILRSKIRGGPIISKQDIFHIWMEIIERNAVEYFCGWVSDHRGKEVTRTVYFPNYSLLLPSVQRTSDLSDFNQSRWRQIIWFEYFDAIDEKLNYQSLTFLPEFPAEFPINGDKPALLKKKFIARQLLYPSKNKN
jgi:hypothetical protein